MIKATRAARNIMFHSMLNIALISVGIPQAVSRAYIAPKNPPSALRNPPI